MSKGLYFYKLISPYEEDVTKNCKLTVNEIDSNFLNLKDEDIKSAELDEETKSVILTRNNGDKLVVDLTPILSGAVYDLEIVYENPDTGSCGGGSTIYVKYSTLTKDDIKQAITIPITGLVTTENINTVLGGGLLTKVTTDSTLQGNGTSKSPLGISILHRNTPAIRLIDRTNGETLPETPKKGDKYVTKERISDFGRLYNRTQVEQIKEILREEFGDDEYAWHIPSKEEWDCILNYVEPCDPVYRNHGDQGTNIELGKYAGKKLKAECAWLGSKECECKNTRPDATFCPDNNAYQEDEDVDNNDYFDDEPNIYEPTECEGINEYGMNVYPTGIKGRFDAAPKKTDSITAFWTDTLLCDSTSDYYIKMFTNDKCGVIQESANPNDFYSIRLVKRFNGENHIDTETIDGNNYNTLLFAECETIWADVNFYSNIEGSATGGNINKYGRIVYYINVWNGSRWEKRALLEGESIVIIEGNEHCLYNVDYRIYVESNENSCNSQILIKADDAVAEEVVNEIIDEYINPISGAIDTEREERISGETELRESIEKEAAERAEADEQILSELNEEREERISADTEIWEVIGEQESAVTELWEALNSEISDRIEADENLQTEIQNEKERAISAETEIAENLEQEISRAVSAETALEEEIDNVENELIDEIQRAKDKEDEIEGQLIDPSNNPYTLNACLDGETPGMVLKSKDNDDEHFIKIQFDGNFGEI